MQENNPSSPRAALVSAAEYVRMSTEHQQYSTENQSDAIRRYAEAHGCKIVRSYSDAGRSGLNISGRPGLRQLLEDVQAGNVDFTVVLVYDISRWGRFQDADESGYYEYICKRANVRVHYCAEQFANDDSLPSSLLKTIKRTMAGEYSRELSVKVFAGQCRLIELGFRQGGPAGYGLQRQLVDRDRISKEILARGQHKSIQTDRVVLIPGPPEEVENVRQMYELFTRERKSEREIADWLNSRGFRTDLHRLWTRGTVHQVLTNPKYVGTNVFNRRSFKLKQRRINNPPEMWIRCDDAFTPIVTVEQFAEAAVIVQARSRHLSDAELLERLRFLLGRYGTLSGILIDESEDMPSSSCFRQRFGSLVRAYQLVGFSPSRDFRYLEINRMVRRAHQRELEEVISKLEKCGASVSRDSRTDLLRINQEYSASLVLVRCREISIGNYRWVVRLDNTLEPDVTIAARLAPENTQVLDYYLLPRMEEMAAKLRLSANTNIVLDACRFDNLNFLMAMSRRVAVGEAA
jgi:DNA invertase Pin-like site-specific DNA recombinase